MDKLTEEFVKYLMDTEKAFKKNNIKLPLNDEKASLELLTKDLKEKLMLDIDRKSKIELKVTLQNRYSTVPLVRIDLNSPPHMFPDGSRTARDHIHFYNAKNQNYDTFDLIKFKEFDCTDLSFASVFDQFCRIFNIEAKIIQGVI